LTVPAVGRLETPGILSPARLPIPPLSRVRGIIAGFRGGNVVSRKLFVPVLAALAAMVYVAVNLVQAITHAIASYHP